MLCSTIHRIYFIPCLFVILGMCTSLNVALANSPDNGDFIDLSLQDLLSIEVTSVSKTEQSLRDVATAIHVISADDIQRSGAQTIPDILRTVPGMNVALVSGASWAVSARGFNDVRARKLLILIDGRSIYSPFYGGVFWNAQEIPLYEIERIEIIRGPGGTIWGANAVNGVINIITRHTAESQGSMVSMSTANTLQTIVNARFGGQLNDSTYYRVYSKARNTGNTSLGEKSSNSYFRADGFELLSDSTQEEAKFIQTGFRIDHQKNVMNNLTLQGDIYKGVNDSHSEIAIPTSPYKDTVKQENLTGGNILGRWNLNLENDSTLMLQAYFDRNKTDIDFFSYEHNTFDIEFQYHFGIFENHSFIWGGGYRNITDKVKNAFFLHVVDENHSDQVFNTFIQDEINLRLINSKLTLGSKFEHNDYTGIEIQPGARFVWTPSSKFSLWSAVSRAVHTPTRFDHEGGVDIYLPYPYQPADELIPTIISVKGNPELKSEELLAHELGGRTQLSKTVSLDLALFHNTYKNLRGRLGLDPDFTTSPGTMILPSSRANNLSGTSIGGELAVSWQANSWWKLQGNYSYLKMKLDSDVNEPKDEDLVERSPSHQFNLISNMNVNRQVHWNITFRYVSQIKNYERSRGAITKTYNVPQYLELDTRIDWQPQNHITLSLIGRNLRDKHHWEFPKTPAASSQEIRRSIATEIRVDF